MQYTMYIHYFSKQYRRISMPICRNMVLKVPNTLYSRNLGLNMVYSIPLNDTPCKCPCHVVLYHCWRLENIWLVMMKSPTLGI